MCEGGRGGGEGGRGEVKGGTGAGGTTAVAVGREGRSAVLMLLSLKSSSSCSIR